MPAAIGVLLVLLAAACPGGGQPGPSPTASSTPTTSSPPSGVEPIFLDVVAPMSKGIGTQVSDESTYLNGMQLAVEDVNAAGGVGGRPIVLTYRDDRDDADEATRIIGDILSQGSTAILYVGAGTALIPLQTQFAQAGTPVVLLEGDLYTGQDMFRQVFQTTIPWVWQANVIARYVVTDRKAKDIVFIGTGPEAPGAATALGAALSYWGGHLTESFDDTSRDPTTGMSAALDRAASADWAVAFGPPVDVLGLVNGIEEAEFGDRQAGITSSASLLVSDPRLAQPDPGRTACYTYTWAGWAEPIPRVGRFLERFEAMFGNSPVGLEQEGYDAVRILVDSLKATEGAGGRRLTAALESILDRTHASFPVDLGPDDHVFLPRDQLGLFAVAGPKERLDPWQIVGSQPWRPVMRTFTYDGERDNILDRDRRVFFPFWRKNQPGPEYWLSRYGIVTGPEDSLH